MLKESNCLVRLVARRIVRSIVPEKWRVVSVQDRALVINSKLPEIEKARRLVGSKRGCWHCGISAPDERGDELARLKHPGGDLGRVYPRVGRPHRSMLHQHRRVPGRRKGLGLRVEG